MSVMAKPANDLDECRWPALSEPYASALREAVEWVSGRFDVVGIIAAGSIVRGRPDASSDLDLYVIHLPLVRQRIQRFFSGVPAEIFVNPPQAIRRYFAAEHREARPITAHMLGTGATVLVRDPACA
jgi:predicted nucleotidyltransferase